MNGIRYLVNRVRGREMVVSVDLLGRPALISVAARRELARVRSVSTEVDLLGRLLEHVEPDDVAYDIGANIGIVSLLLALHRDPGAGRVHAFEPEPVNFDRLRRNIELNDVADRIVPQRLALGAGQGEAELFVRPGAGEGRHSLATAAGSRGSIRVPLDTITGFARSSGEPPDLLKVDVEGAEGQVLEGLDGLLPVHRPRELFIEIHPKGGGDAMPDGQPIHDWLAERGYDLSWERRERSRIQRHYR